MAENIKEKIYNFLKENSPKRYNLSQLKRETGISYPTILKWVEVLIVEQDRNPKLNVEDYGSIKLVWVE